MENQITAAKSSRRRSVKKQDSGNPVSDSQPPGVAAHLQSIAESLAELVKINRRIADAIESQDHKVVHGMRPYSVSCKEAGNYIGVRERSIKSLIDNGDLPDAMLFDKKGQVVKVDDLEKLVDERRAAARSRASETKPTGRKPG